MATTKKRSKKHEFYSGKRLRQFRRKNNWTRDDLEFECAGEVTARTLFNWEKDGIPANVQKQKLEAVCKALSITLEDLEKVEIGYLESLTLDVVQERLENAAEDMKAQEIGKIFEFLNKQEPDASDTTDVGADVYDPLKDLVEEEDS